MGVKLGELPEQLSLHNEHVLLHVALKDLRHLSSDYHALAWAIIEQVKQANPKCIIVPTFTYSFTKTQQFNLTETASEVGRFSEEIRRKLPANNRSKDPVFSVVDVLGTAGIADKWNADAFGQNSVWQQWDTLNGIIINIGLPQLVSTQLHYIERNAQVPYRYDKLFSGKVIGANGEDTNEFDYNYYVRDLELKPKWDRPKIKACLKDAGVLTQASYNNVELCWFKARDMREIIQPIMQHDANYFLQ